MRYKLIQVPVVKGKGSEQFFVEKEISVPCACPPIYSIKDIKKSVDVFDVKVIKGKVIFNAFLRKDIVYTTVDKKFCDSVCGPVFHFTAKIPFGGFVEIKPIYGEMLMGECEIAKLLEAKIEGSRELLTGEIEKDGVKVFTKLIEKDIVKLKFKVERIEEIKVETSPYVLKDDENDEPADELKEEPKIESKEDSAEC